MFRNRANNRMGVQLKPGNKCMFSHTPRLGTEFGALLCEGQQCSFVFLAKPLRVLGKFEAQFT